MDELDDDFKELRANLLSRVNKKRGDAEGERKVPNRTRDTAARSKLKKSKPAAKSQSQPGMMMTWPECLDPHRQALTPKKEGGPLICGSEGTALEDGCGGHLPTIPLNTTAANCNQNSLADCVLNSSSQTTSSFPAAGEPEASVSSPSKTLLVSGSRVRVTELVLERMQQFKRVAPEQLKHTSDKSLLEPVADEKVPDANQGKNELGNGVNPDLPTMEQDVALALTLQQEFKQEVPRSLEESGLFFCQICQKDLSAMNSTRREQHVNRCLDETEKSQVSSSNIARVPECPICGKQFQIPKSRASHLKHCAVKMQVPPQLLLQAVKLQASSLSEILPPAPSTQVSRSKRKGGSKEQAKKKPKMSKAETADEDVLVAMAMSRSLQEHEKQKQEESVTGGKPESALPIKWKPGSKKKSRKKLSLAPPPLLLQDPETSCKQIQDRVAMLLTEDVEFSCTPPLPFSRILEDEPEKTEWLLPLPKDKRCILWEFSALTGPCDPETFYAAGLTPPILPCKPVQSQKSETVFSLMGSDQPQLIQQQPVISHPTPAELGNKLSDEPQTGPCEDSPSRKDVQILQDLIELAGEGLTLTQWNHDVHLSHTEEQSRKESAPTDIPLSGFVPPYTGKRCQRSSHDRPLLQSLAFDFSGMVNNPHLSDIQFQVDSGEVLYAHMFVLYARCPQAVEMAHNEGLLVEEDGNLQIRRVLLSEVTAEATYAFLQYLYSADSNIRPHVLSDVRILAARFGVSELIAVCRSSPGENQEPSEVDSGEELFSVGDDEDCENRAENFKELLKSMWIDEDEEEIALLKPEGEEEEDHEKVDEQELEEIYEFAATQRKMAQDKPQEKNALLCAFYSESEKAQDMNQQVDDKKRKVFESLSACSKIKEWKGNINLGRSRCDLRTQEKKIQGPDRCEGINVTQITTVHCQDESYKCSDNAMSCGAFSGERQTTRTPRVSRSYQASQDEKEEDPWEKLFPGHQHSVVALDVSYEHIFSATQGDYCDPASLNENIKDPGETNSEKCVEINNSPVCHQSQKSLESGKSNFCHSPLIKLCTPLFPAIGSSPLSAKLNQTLSRVYTGIHPISTPIRDLSLDDVPFYKASEQGFVSRHENIKRRVFPDRSPCIHLNKKKSLSPSSSQILKTQDATSHMNKEPDIIVLSDSDEEIELKQAKEESDSGSSLRETEISRKLDYICKKVEQDPKVPKSEPVSVVDKDVHQRLSQVSLGIQNEVHSNAAAEVLPEMHVNSWAGTSVDSKLNLNLSCGKEYSCEENSSMDASWLVPGTPFLSKSRNYSTQTQVSSMRNLNCQESTHKTEVLVVDNNSHKPSRTIINSPEPTSGGLPVILSQKPFHQDNTVSKRNSSGSQLGQCSKDFLPISPVPTSPLSPNCASVKEKSSESSSSARQVPPCYKQSLANKTDFSVVEVEDSEEEKDATPLSPSSNVLLGDDPPVPVDDAFWDVEYLSPIRETSKEPEKSDCSNNSKSDPKEEQWKTPARPLEVRGSTPLRGSPFDTHKLLSCDKKSPVEILPSMGNRLSFLDSKVWDSWNGDEDDLPEVIPLTQRLSAAAVAQNTELLKTPHPICPKKNLPPKVPITPMPEYSIMETPELKKELNRFGVRPLPKHQMVLKLKEIFQYTHQVMESDSEDEFSSSQPPLWKATAKHCSPSKADGTAVRTKSSKASSGASKQKMSILVPSLPVLGSTDDNVMGPSTTSCAAAKMSAETKSHAGDASRQNKVTLSLAASPVKGSLAISTDEQMLSASQESAMSSGDGTDHSFGSQSSSANEFETCALALEEDYNEGVPASQTATQDADKQEAVRRYIHSNPALYRRILFYEPLELAELQAELKQNGIKIGLGKLLDFLDAHCITFTTAGTRKEKQQHRGKKKRGKRY
ncbi:PREDICTED: structure-specific endonuclease subunit SLX4 [Gavialis gangeticus]|uniref:structure-specific endonuclease subunit SLX4 n=1 Tax=Gavialis gangeticus TaxID=94835 RepID=UPI00092F9F7A|nr:PREDICTED: structure-specific endonuclease subunit SLX4 [Gavialis gangeticus]